MVCRARLRPPAARVPCLALLLLSASPPLLLRKRSTGWCATKSTTACGYPPRAPFPFPFFGRRFRARPSRRKCAPPAPHTHALTRSCSFPVPLPPQALAGQSFSDGFTYDYSEPVTVPEDERARIGREVISEGGVIKVQFLSRNPV